MFTNLKNFVENIWRKHYDNTPYDKTIYISKTSFAGAGEFESEPDYYFVAILDKKLVNLYFDILEAQKLVAAATATKVTPTEMAFALPDYLRSQIYLIKQTDINFYIKAEPKTVWEKNYKNFLQGKDYCLLRRCNINFDKFKVASELGPINIVCQDKNCHFSFTHEEGKRVTHPVIKNDWLSVMMLVHE